MFVIFKVATHRSQRKIFDPPCPDATAPRIC
ncbi:protein of unknown function [Rhodovastum atsumiense]|nr:protein of unknown function [Rhodovastum atsumiense]